MIRLTDPQSVGALALGRRATQHDLSLALEVGIGCSLPGALTEQSFWPAAIAAALTTDRSGHIALLYDHHRTDGIAALQETLSPAVQLAPTRGITHLAEEGLSTTVSFTRLLRPVLRRIRQQGATTVLCLHGIFADARTERVLQRVAGTQLRVVTLGPALEQWAAQQTRSSGPLTLHTTLSPKWTHHRAQQLLQRQIPMSALQPLPPH
ncbi:hypothetical protein H6771_00335 [Candidatus Peribacteria bacterium]|nr:hypothetical protein [Candidatus Peribacteria bacterium]